MNELRSAPLLGTASAANAIARVRYTHDDMINQLITNPTISQNELAQRYGYTVPWVSRLVNSDAFQLRLAQRKDDLVDPTIILSLDERFNALAVTSTEILHEKLVTSRSPDLALKTLELSANALGYGARKQNINVQQSFVVAMPEKVPDAQEWATTHQKALRAGNQGAVIIEADVKEI